VGPGLKAVAQLPQGGDEHIVVEGVYLIQQEYERLVEGAAPVGQVLAKEGITARVGGRIRWQVLFFKEKTSHPV